MSTAMQSVIVPATAPKNVVTNSRVAIAGTNKYLSKAKRHYRPLTIISSSSEHKAAECPEPRKADGVECRKCNEGMLASRLSDLVSIV